MKSNLPKVLHKVGGWTIIEHVGLLAQKINSTQSIFVVPQDHTPIKDSLKSNRLIKKSSRFAVQSQQLGTGHALKCALDQIKAKSGLVVVLNGDMPLIQSSTIRRLVTAHEAHKGPITLLIDTILDQKLADVQGKNGFGRIIRDESGAVKDIVEVKEASAQQKKIPEVNVGVYVFDLSFLHSHIGKIKRQNRQREYYLPDLVKLAAHKKLAVKAVKLKESLEAFGINSQKDLNMVNQIFYQMQKDKFMKDGVTIIGDEVFIDAAVKLNSGVALESPCYLKGDTSLQQNVTIEMGCSIRSSQIHSGTLIKAHSYIDQAKIGSRCQVGPFAHLRSGSELLNQAKIGNFVETKKSQIGEGSKVNHLSYIGDTLIGKKVNVGAGTITCNYDGFNKYQTVLEDGVFVGSDTQLVAPVRIGKGAVIGAGTTVTKDVGANNLVISRVPQREIPEWGKRHRQKNGY